ncbi:unnamed protein product [Paramecium sonneborni]|uniref:WD40-repeat-containing domain n=1 Tax=Paramecium sonneborni TaxID=65129 RepID=A0A8S1MHS9_9CILI|nr:unnamed protein product [Paramecium sonneborni]
MNYEEYIIQERLKLNKKIEERYQIVMQQIQQKSQQEIELIKHELESLRQMSDVYEQKFIEMEEEIKKQQSIIKNVEEKNSELQIQNFQLESEIKLKDEILLKNVKECMNLQSNYMRHQSKGVHLFKQKIKEKQRIKKIKEEQKILKERNKYLEQLIEQQLPPNQVFEYLSNKQMNEADQQPDKNSQQEQVHIGNQNQMQQENQNQIFTFKAPWSIYAMGFQSKPTPQSRIAIGSMIEDIQNEVYILQLDKEQEAFFKKAKFNHRYAPTKVLWIPDVEGKYPDLLATSGENLKVWEYDDQNAQVKIKWDLKNTSDFNAPLTSFDWSCKQQNYIGTASIDTTCTLWDIEKQTVFTQLIAHDKEVYDICFSVDHQIFASVGADGSCRQFDLRALDHSTVLYETENSNPIVRLAWNKMDTNYLAIIEMDVNYVTLLDTRQPLLPLAKLKNHKDFVNAIAWAPESTTHLCSVSDDFSALIWDFSELQNKQNDLNSIDPLLEYKAENEISNLSWSLTKIDQVSICYNKSCQILNV